MPKPSPPRIRRLLPPRLARRVLLDLLQKLLFLPLATLHPAVERHTAGPFLRQGDERRRRLYERARDFESFTILRVFTIL